MISLHAFLMSIRAHIIQNQEEVSPYLCFAAEDIYGRPGKRVIQKLLEEVYPDGYRLSMKANLGFCDSLEVIQYWNEHKEAPALIVEPHPNDMKLRMEFIEMILRGPDRMITFK